MTAIYYVLFITCFIQIVFYAIIFSKYIRSSQTAAKISIDSFKPASVVICAKNEFENLTKFLPIILEQDHPDFEVIVIDDGSNDASPQLLQSFEDRYPNFFSFRIEPSEKTHPGKKQALQYGISVAKNPHIVVTDADCFPKSKQWLQLMTTPLHNEADVVLGISPFEEKQGIANLFFRMEAYFVALQYINFTLSGLPFMGVGRNMAYKKEVFNAHDIASHWDLASGDDDLFINAISSEYKVEVVTHPQSYTYSAAPADLKTWFRQKLRHYTAGYRYDMVQKIWLGYYWLSSATLYALLIIVPVLYLFKNSFSKISLTLLFGTAMLRWIITLLSVNKMEQQNRNFAVPIMDFAYILSVWIVSPLSTIIKRKWK